MERSGNHSRLLHGRSQPRSQSRRRRSMLSGRERTQMICGNKVTRDSSNLGMQGLSLAVARSLAGWRGPRPEAGGPASRCSEWEGFHTLSICDRDEGPGASYMPSIPRNKRAEIIARTYFQTSVLVLAPSRLMVALT